MGTNQPQQPQTAEQINNSQTGAYSFTEISKIAFQTPGRAKVELKKVASEIDRLRFALERVVNLLQHAEPMMALQVAERALNPNQTNEHE